MDTHPQLAIDFEAQAKEEALDGMEASELRAYYLDRIRREMAERARRTGKVTPDDAREFFEGLAPPSPEDLSRNFLACVFRGKDWKVVGTYKSRTPGSHANELKVYALKEAA